MKRVVQINKQKTVVQVKQSLCCPRRKIVKKKIKCPKQKKTRMIACGTIFQKNNGESRTYFRSFFYRPHALISIQNDGAADILATIQAGGRFSEHQISQGQQITFLVPLLEALIIAGTGSGYPMCRGEYGINAVI